MPFGGKTYDPMRDRGRLTGQLLRTWQVMFDGRERTLAQIARETSLLREDGGQDSEAAISARLRDFRKPKFGEHEVYSRNLSGGLWGYRLERRTDDPDDSDKPDPVPEPDPPPSGPVGACGRFVSNPYGFKSCGKPTLPGRDRCAEHAG